MQNPSAKIISASRRTDIPAFYSEWFMNRVREGLCEVANPFNPNQISNVSLKPEDVIALVFWTRNPKPLMPFLAELDERGFKYYFLYTITGYPRVIEKSSPDCETAIETFQELSRQIGREKVIWRYDPLLLSNFTPLDWHIAQVTRLVKSLSGYTDKMIISIVEPYQKTLARLKRETDDNFKLDERCFDPEAYYPIFEHIGKAAKANGIMPISCAQKYQLKQFGIENGSCIEGDLINRLTGLNQAWKRDTNQREFCQCVPSKDIGANNSCLFNCAYCYATVSHQSAMVNFKKHNKFAKRLIG